MMRQITDPWHYAFFRHGMLAAVLAGALAGLIGFYVVLRRMSYIGHGLSHAISVARWSATAWGSNFYVFGGLWGAMSALLISAVHAPARSVPTPRSGSSPRDRCALGVAIISRGHSFTRNFEAALFGNILGVTTTDLYVLGGVGVAVGLAIFFLYKQLLRHLRRQSRRSPSGSAPDSSTWCSRWCSQRRSSPPCESSVSPSSPQRL